MKKRLCALGAIGIAAVGIGATFMSEKPVEAADHLDPSGVVTAGDSVDIADFYAWHDADADTLTLIVTYAGPVMPSADQAANYDPDTLYGIHIDNDGDNVDDHDIWVRFGQNDLGDWGVQVQGLPGEAGPVVGAVEATITGEGGTKVFAGLRDDPFFFDLVGFSTTVQNLMDTADDADFAFDPSRDFFPGQNISSIVIEVPLAAAQGTSGETSMGLWTSARKFGVAP